MTQAFLQTSLGANSPYISIHVNIEGRSINNYGDIINVAGSNIDFTSNVGGKLGWTHVGSDDLRAFIIYNIDQSALEAKLKIGRAIFKPVVQRRTGSNPGDLTINVFEIEGTIAAGTTFLLRATGITWYGGGYGPKPGYDYDSTQLDTQVLTTAEWTTLQSGNDTVRIVKEFDITDAAQRARDEKRNLPLLMMLTDY